MNLSSLLHTVQVNLNFTLKRVEYNKRKLSSLIERNIMEIMIDIDNSTKLQKKLIYLRGNKSISELVFESLKDLYEQEKEAFFPTPLIVKPKDPEKGIVLDLDEMLLPICHYLYTLKRLNRIHSINYFPYKEFDRVLLSVFKLAKQKSKKVYLNTNFTLRNFKYCLSTFLPHTNRYLFPTLTSNVKLCPVFIVSAKDKYQRGRPWPASWKVKAYQAIHKHFLCAKQNRVLFCIGNRLERQTCKPYYLAVLRFSCIRASVISSSQLRKYFIKLLEIKKSLKCI